MIVLPYPPSVNTYYRHLKTGRTLISAKGREYRQAVIAKVGKVKKLTGELEVKIVLFAPDKRKRDIDNTLKALFDSLTHAGVWEDDSQVRKLIIEMKPKATEYQKGIAGIEVKERETA